MALPLAPPSSVPAEGQEESLRNRAQPILNHDSEHSRDIMVYTGYSCPTVEHSNRPRHHAGTEVFWESCCITPATPPLSSSTLPSSPLLHCTFLPACQSSRLRLLDPLSPFQRHDTLRIGVETRLTSSNRSSARSLLVYTTTRSLTLPGWPAPAPYLPLSTLIPLGERDPRASRW